MNNFLLKNEHARQRSHNYDKDIDSEMKKIIDFNSKNTFKCLICNNNRQFKGTLYNAKDHVSAVHKAISIKMGLAKVYQQKLQRKSIKNKKCKT